MLRDHEPADWTTDQFKLAEDEHGTVHTKANLCFPCCCCLHNSKDERDDPCRRCGHNVNSTASQRTR